MTAFQTMIDIITSLSSQGNPIIYDETSKTIKFNKNWETYVKFCSKLHENCFVLTCVEYTAENTCIKCWKENNLNDSFIINIEYCAPPDEERFIV